MGQGWTSLLTVHYGTHPLGIYRTIPQSVRTLRIIRGINPNTHQVFF